MGLEPNFRCFNFPQAGFGAKWDLILCMKYNSQSIENNCMKLFENIISDKASELPVLNYSDKYQTVYNKLS